MERSLDKGSISLRSSVTSALPSCEILDTSLTIPRVLPPSLAYRMKGLNQVIFTVFSSSDVLHLRGVWGGSSTYYIVRNEILELVCQWSDPEVSPLNSSNFHLLPHLSWVSKHLSQQTFIYDSLCARHHTHIPAKLVSC